jgi:hypothetical protein
MRNYSKNISQLRKEYSTTDYLMVDKLLNVHMVFLQKKFGNFTTEMLSLAAYVLRNMITEHQQNMSDVHTALEELYEDKPENETSARLPKSALNI